MLVNTSATFCTISCTVSELSIVEEVEEVVLDNAETDAGDDGVEDDPIGEDLASS